MRHITREYPLHVFFYVLCLVSLYVVNTVRCNFIDSCILAPCVLLVSCLVDLFSTLKTDAMISSGGLLPNYTAIQDT
jgi:hypothetical protein